MLEALSKSVLLFLIAPILVELRPTKKLHQNMLDRGSIMYYYSIFLRRGFLFRASCKRKIYGFLEAKMELEASK